MVVSAAVVVTWRSNHRPLHPRTQELVGGKPLEDYYPFWVASPFVSLKFTNRFKAWPSDPFNQLTPQQLPALVDLLDRPKPIFHDLVTNLHRRPGLPNWIRKFLPVAISSTDSLYLAIEFVLRNRSAESTEWMLAHVESLPADYQPAFIRWLVEGDWLRNPHHLMLRGGQVHRRIGKEPLVATQLLPLLKRLIRSEDPLIRFEAACGLWRWDPSTTGLATQLTEVLEQVAETSEVDSRSWNTFAVALLERPAGADAFLPLLRKLETMPEIARFALVPMARWRLSNPREPLTEFTEGLVTGNHPDAWRWLICALLWNPPEEPFEPAFAPWLTSMLERVATNVSRPNGIAGQFVPLPPPRRYLVRVLDKSEQRFRCGIESSMQLLKRVDISHAELAPLLLRLLRHPEISIRSEAASVLEAIGVGAGLQPIQLRPHLADGWIRLPLLRLLGAYGTNASVLVPELLPLFDSPDRVLRLAAATTARQIAPSDQRLLKVWLEGVSDPGIQQVAVETLAEFGERAAPAVPRLGSLASEESSARGMSEMRVAALNTLVRIGPAARVAMPDVRKALQSPDEKVREAARVVSEKMGGD